MCHQCGSSVCLAAPETMQVRFGHFVNEATSNNVENTIKREAVVFCLHNKIPGASIPLILKNKRKHDPHILHSEYVKLICNEIKIDSS